MKPRTTPLTFASPRNRQGERRRLKAFMRCALGAALGLMSLLAVGCGDDSASTCEAGRQIDCACGGGEVGFQRCRDDGSGFDACVCSGDTGVTDTGVADTSADTAVVDSGPDAPLSCDESAADCTSCYGCVNGLLPDGPCGTENAACGANPECDLFTACASDCGAMGSPPGCQDDCVTMYPDGAALNMAFSTCLNCDACPVKCAAVSMCD